MLAKMLVISFRAQWIKLTLASVRPIVPVPQHTSNTSESEEILHHSPMVVYSTSAAAVFTATHSKTYNIDSLV